MGKRLNNDKGFPHYQNPAQIGDAYHLKFGFLLILSLARLEIGEISKWNGNFLRSGPNEESGEPLDGDHNFCMVFPESF